MNLQDILQKELVIIIGKGGVGKTTIAASLGLLAASQGKKTLLAEINTQGHLAHLFNKSPLKYTEKKLAPNLYGINVLPKKSFEEYVLMHIKLRQLYKVVFENRFVSYFIDATPGLAELMSIGKIYGLVKDYDLIILDSPATGHGFSLLQVPSVVAEAVRVGPLKTQSDKIDALLKDRKKTMIMTVTLPEEMPVNEACEMASKAEDDLALSVEGVVINQVFPEPMTPEQNAEYKRHKKMLDKDAKLAPLTTCMDAYLCRHHLQQEYIQLLTDKFGEENCFKVPYQFTDTIQKGEIEKISNLLRSELTTKES